MWSKWGIRDLFIAIWYTNVLSWLSCLFCTFLLLWWPRKCCPGPVPCGCCKNMHCWNTLPAHKDLHPLQGQHNNALCHLEWSYLQRSDSICTYNVTLCTSLWVIIICPLFCEAKVHEAQLCGLLYCFDNRIPFHSSMPWNTRCKAVHKMGWLPRHERAFH